MITEPINCSEELKRVFNADYDLCAALLTLVLREDHFSCGSFKQRFAAGQVLLILKRMRDAVLRPIISDESDEKILLQIESDEKWIQEQKAGIALYNYVSYLMTGLEVFVNAPYAKMVRLYERETNQSLVYGYDWELGKLLVHYIVPRIERIYQICNMCVQKNYGGTDTLKSLLKSANGIQKEFLRNEMYKYRKMIFEFAKEIINICEYMEQIEENKYFTNIYEEWMEHKVKPYILELLAAVNAGVVSDTENKLFTNVLNEWLETSYDIVNT